MAYINRLKKLEKQHNTAFNEVIRLIQQGAFYDELTDEQKDLYCAYKGHNREAMETIEEYINGSLHLRLEKRQPPPTEAELRKRVKEVEQMMNEHIEEYNLPEAKAERERNRIAWINSKR